jgi:NTE family protein
MSKKISLVLSGGGARGIAHIGVINALLEKGYEIEEIAGTSMGAVVGGVYASGKLKEFQQWLENVTYSDAIKVLDYKYSSPGLLKGDKLMKKLAEFMPIENIEDLNIPFTAVAVNIINGEEKHFTKGSVSKAIRASISIPYVFAPVNDKGMVLVDGGVRNNLPIDLLKQTKNFSIAVNVNANGALKKEYKKYFKTDKKTENEYLKKIEQMRAYVSSFFKSKKEEEAEKKLKKASNSKKIGPYEVIDRSIHLLIGESTKIKLKDNPPNLLIEIPRDVCNTFDFFKAKPLIELGYQSTMDLLKDVD